MIQVAVHCDLAQNTGVARYARSLLIELGQLCSAVSARALTYPLRPQRPAWLPKSVGYRRPWIPGALQRRYVESVNVCTDRFLGRRPDELVHMTIPSSWRPRHPVVFTVYDVAWRSYGREYDVVMPRENARRTEEAIREADHLVSISQTTTEALIASGIDRDRVTTTLLGVEDSFFAGSPEQGRVAANRFGIPGRYVLYVGSINIRKGVPTLVAAMTELVKERDVQLVIAGPPPPEGLAAWGLENSWTKHLGYVDEQDLRDLYSAASATAIPATLEGFGLPLLEAMAAGVPAVASDTPVFREIAGGVALLTEPGDVAEYHAALRRVLDEPAVALELGARGQAHARTFTWGRCAAATVEAYRKALKAR